MNILSLDTTSMTLSCAITNGYESIAEFSLFTDKTHSERMMPLIDSILTSAGINITDIDYYACTVGPGSFTGLRIGISTIKGLAYANGKKVVAVSSLDALCENVPHSKYDICPLIDARKSEVFAAFYKRAAGEGEYAGEVASKSDECNVTPAELVKRIKKKTIFLGNGARLYKDTLKNELKDKAIFVPDELNYIKALNVAKIATRLINEKRAVAPEMLLPVYIRESDAVINLKKK